MTDPGEVAHQLHLTWHGRTVVGQVRTNNEDTLWAACVSDRGAAEGNSAAEAVLDWPGLLLAVADGMGGALAGEVASGMAVQAVARELDQSIEGAELDPQSRDDRERALVDAVQRANLDIRSQGERNPQQRGMGTTLTAAWLHHEHAEIAQIGDSRAYLFRGGHLRQLTKDQSLVSKLIEDNIITEEEAERIAGRNIILQALGSDDDLEVAYQRVALESGDHLVLCTDGLTTVVNNGALEDELRRGGSPEDICKRLIEMAESRGGPDNITVIVGVLKEVH